MSLVPKPSIHMKGLSRKCYTAIFRAITGHGNNKYLLHEMRLADTNVCESDNIRIDNMDHWCFGCAYNRLASEYLLAKIA